jgi:beta-glucosidase/6-phospho-beta-glucosidase/beta-galactosidase
MTLPSLGVSVPERGPSSRSVAAVSLPTWPENFDFGVATAGFQIEGGYNGPGQPRNNWAPWEDLGRVSRAGAATGFWDGFEDQLDLVVAMGLTSLRLSIEWTRVEPERGEFDPAAIGHYRRILEAVRARGLRPLVTLHHFTHPAWLGPDPWLDDHGWRALARWYEFAVTTFGDLCDTWITSNEINIFAINTYFHGIFPPGRRGDLAATMTTIDHLLAAHILGYQSIKALQPGSVVATNNYSFSIYELDRLILDTLHAHARGLDGVRRTDWLAERRAEHYARVPGARGAFAPLERALRALAARRIDLADALPVTRGLLASATTARLLDVAQLDYYAPTAAEHLTLPGHRTAGGRWWRLGRPLWDDRPDPEMFLAYLSEAGQDGLAVWVVENGMCVRRDARGSWPRRDGWTRERYLRENLGALVAARRRGVDVTGYWHWTLVDNFEWGSYQPRFGLHALDPTGRILASDAAGDDAAGAYRRIVTGLTGGDLSVVREPR